MAKWLRDYLSFGARRPPPQPPTPDYTESDILRAYREQKDLDFEDPYEDADGRPEPDPGGAGDAKYDSPKHRLIKVEAADAARAKVLLGSPGGEVRGHVPLAGWPREPRWGGPGWAPRLRGARLLCDPRGGPDTPQAPHLFDARWSPSSLSHPALSPCPPAPWCPLRSPWAGRLEEPS